MAFALSRKVVVLNQDVDPGTGCLRTVLALWIQVPAGQQLPNPGFRSAALGKDAPDANTEVPLFVSGDYVEVLVSVMLPTISTWDLTTGPGQIKVEAYLKDVYDTAVLNFKAPGRFYGSNLKADGTTWANRAP